ncbi:GNAT family N-acetyltransferase [Actinokineospora sp. HUAS TT18]|uniref:GNAT family N-acetyltransferase n=1 Tax=Actinokineospora sp. HUAS TT18 TaxID=3447451 RepID=UPI003F52541F
MDKNARPHRNLTANINLPEEKGEGALDLLNAEAVVVGQVTFHWTPSSRRLEITQLDIWEDYQREGYGREIIYRLAEIAPGVKLVDNPLSNSLPGSSLLQAVRKEGIIVHTYECGGSSAACSC